MTLSGTKKLGLSVIYPNMSLNGFCFLSKLRTYRQEGPQKDSIMPLPKDILANKVAIASSMQTGPELAAEVSHRNTLHSLTYFGITNLKQSFINR